MIAATRSIPEWIASDRILTDPLMSPAMTFRMISNVFDTTDNLAILFFSVIMG